MALEQTQSEVGKKSCDSDKAAIRLKEQIPAKGLALASRDMSARVICPKEQGSAREKKIGYSVRTAPSR